MPEFYFFYIPIFFIAWAVVFPMQAMAMIEKFNKQQAHFIIQHLSNKDIHLLKERFREWGRIKGYEQRLIDEMLDKHATEIVQRVESRYSQVNIDELLQ